MTALICKLTGLKVSDANLEIRCTNQGGADHQLAGECCSPGEDNKSDGNQQTEQKIQQESDYPANSKRSDVGELYSCLTAVYTCLPKFFQLDKVLYHKRYSTSDDLRT